MRTAELAQQVIPQVSTCCLGHRLPGDDPDHGDAGREAVGPHRERQEREIPAVAAAIDADPCRVGKLLIAEPCRTARDVLEIFPAPIVAVRFTPLLSVTGRTSGIRLEDDKARVYEDLRSDVPL